MVGTWMGYEDSFCLLFKTCHIQPALLLDIGTTFLASPLSMPALCSDRARIKAEAPESGVYCWGAGSQNCVCVENVSGVRAEASTTNVTVLNAIFFALLF